MSGSIGANRIPSSAVKATVQSFIDKVLKKYPTFKSAKITGSYNIIPKDEEGNVILEAANTAPASTTSKASSK
mgnify:CR=1 FL=1